MKKGISILLALIMVLSVFAVIPCSVSAVEADIAVLGIESTGNSRFDEFISNPNWQDGVYWWGNNETGTPPKYNVNYGSSGCGAYAADFVLFCHGVYALQDGIKYTSGTSEIRAGDVVRVTGHFFCVLKRSGNSLYTAEGNFNSYTRVGWNYTISGNNLVSGSFSAAFEYGYHYGSTPTPEISYTVNLNDGDYLKGSSCAITGRVDNGGTYPWLHLYMDYAWVADTANNSYGNYAFYLDTTKYSDGEHLLGVKITNDDGVDYTTWKRIIIDNTLPVVEAKYLSLVTDNSFRVCIVPKDNLGIKEVRIATWTQNDQSDLIWKTANNNGSGTYFVDIKRSDYSQTNNTYYYNHAYVYDYAGNSVFAGFLDLDYSDNTPPIISNPRAENVSGSSFDIKCDLSDNIGVTRVWLNIYGPNGSTNGYAVSASNGSFAHTIKTTDYDGAGIYVVHIYAFDAVGNETPNAVRAYAYDNPVSTLEYKSQRYELFNNKMTWKHAKEICESRGGHLAFIETSEENEMLTEFAGSLSNYVWIGASDEAREGYWYWTDGNMFSFSNWYSGEPNNTDGAEHYLQLIVSGSSKGQWNDAANNSSEVSGFICEYNSITVTYAANGHGTAPAQQTVKNGEKATKPADPTATGWTFGGWYTDAACTTAYDFNTAVTKSITLYAKWTQKSYTVSYNANGHGTAPAAQTVKYGNKATKPADLSVTGWTFGGWYTDAACTTAYDFDTAVTKSITLYAKWTQKSYKVTCDANGHGTAPAAQTVKYGNKATKPADLSVTGWTFGGWYTDAACTTAYDFDTAVTKSFTLYAKWTQKSYKVTYDANGHGTAPAAQTVKYGNKATKPADLTATGWTFGGWYADAACTTAYDFNTAVTKSITLYAKWTQKSYKVTYDANGHGTAPAAQTVKYGNKATRLADLTATGWTFGGWYTDAACTTVYDFTAAVTSNLTLYAKWEIELAVPEITKIDNTVLGVRLTIGEVAGGAKYHIYRKTGTSDWTLLTDITGLSYIDKTAVSGTRYTYTVSVSDSEESTVSNYDPAGKSILYIGRPVITGYQNGNNATTVTWRKVPGAKYYRVYGMGSGAWKVICSKTTSLSFTYHYNHPVSGKAYYYTVRAYGNDGEISVSDYQKSGWKITYIAPPSLPTLKNTKSGVKITIKKVTGAAKYRIFRKTGSGKWKKLVDTTKLSYVDKTAKRGVTYRYTIRCISKDRSQYTSSYYASGRTIKCKR